MKDLKLIAIENEIKFGDWIKGYELASAREVAKIFRDKTKEVEAIESERTASQYLSCLAYALTALYVPKRALKRAVEIYDCASMHLSFSQFDTADEAVYFLAQDKLDKLKSADSELVDSGEEPVY